MTELHRAKLYNIYNKKLKQNANYLFENNKAGLMSFAEYLRFLRDCIILSTKADTATAATITMAVAELDAYLGCTDSSKSLFHWNNFCELIRLNMEEWLKINDSV